MFKENWKIEKDLCRCCHNEGRFKSLAEPCTVSGQAEVYSVMLRDCFDIDMAPALGALSSMTYKICEPCISQLRDAMNFKKQILKCEELFRDMYGRIVIDVPNKPAVDVKQEIQDTGQNVLLMKMELECREDTEIVDNDDDDGPVNANNNPSLKAEDIEELNILKDGNTNDSKSTKLLLRNKLKRNILKSKKGKSRQIFDTKNEIQDKRKINSIKLRQNAGLILEHSTIVPFKFNKGYFNCLYCTKPFTNFNDLKCHVSQNHENNSFKTIIKCLTRPKDPTKADVSDISCSLCKKKIANLEALIKHLTDEHGVKFNYEVNMKPNDCILPYILRDGNNICYYCKAEFSFFNTLSEHMNEHSTKHVCEICGKCFILPQRLRAHLPTHNVEDSATCDICGKIFNTKLLLKGHMRFKHLKINYKCSICKENFPDSKSRILHLEEVHNRPPLNLTCKYCSKSFGALNSLNSHIRMEHTHRHLKRERKHACGVCGKTFNMRKGLRNHLVVHSDEKKYECEFCHKKYGRIDTMREHLKIHKNDKRWTCGACSQAFVQKSSLRNHIRVHHADLDLEQLIVYKKRDDHK